MEEFIDISILNMFQRISKTSGESTTIIYEKKLKR